MTKITKRIIETAERLFYNDGFNITGVDLIRDEAKCSKTTMYKNIGNKDDLTLSVLKNRDEKLRRSLSSFVGDKARDFEAVSKIFEWHKNWFQDIGFNGCLFVRASYELQNKNADIYQAIMDHKDWVRGFIEERISNEYIQNGVSESIVTLLEGLISLHSVYEDKDIRDSYSKSSLKMVKIMMDSFKD